MTDSPTSTPFRQDTSDHWWTRRRTRRLLLMQVGICVAVAVVASGCGTSTGDDQAATSSVGVTLAPTTTSVTAAPPHASLEDLVAAREPDGVGAILVGVFEGSSEELAAGGRDGDGHRVTVDQAWETASLVKMIVATSVLQLVDQGLIELDAPVAQYVDFPIAEAIQVRDVLNHRSGIADMTEHLSHCPTVDTLDAMTQRAADALGPTNEAEYSNTNYILLGYLVAAVSGQDIADHADEHIFEPLGMEGTYWWETQDGPDPYWHRAVSDPGQVSPFTCPDLEVTVGTEGLTFVSTLHDLGVFLRGLFGGGLVSRTSLAEMLPDDSPGVGLGIWSEADAQRQVTVYGHYGARSGFSAIAYYAPEYDRAIVAFATEPTDVEQLMWQAWDLADERASGVEPSAP